MEKRIVEAEWKEGEQSFEGMVGATASMQRIFSLIRQFADSDANVLITGETGTGKELVARALHNAGSRAQRPMIRIACNEIPESLMETHLFGHAKGAFTGAGQDQTGYFESAEGGTVFLDEISDIPLHIQAKLLRVVDSKEFIRIGERITRRADIRIVSATNTELPELIRKGGFREDLGFRLKGVTIPMPPLRERREDIPLLSRYFLAAFSPDRAIHISDEVYDILMNYPWPGNVRQLKNMLEFTAAMCRQDTITVRDFPPGFGSGRYYTDQEPAPEKLTKETVLAALEKSGWNRSAAARMLGCSRSTLYRKAEEYSLFDMFEKSDLPPFYKGGLGDFSPSV